MIAGARRVGSLVTIYNAGGVYMRRVRLLDHQLFGLKLHLIYCSDEPGRFHNHPWSFVSVTLSRRYEEEILRGDGMVQRRRSFIRRVHCRRLHRVDVPSGVGPVVTLVAHGRVSNSWHFVSRSGVVSQPASGGLLAEHTLAEWLSVVFRTGHFPTRPTFTGDCPETQEPKQ